MVQEWPSQDAVLAADASDATTTTTNERTAMA